MARETTFLNRVPTYPGRVKLTHVGGDFYDMERADEPVVVGTPIDKATFDSIVQSRLTGRYYEPGYTLAQVSQVTGLTTNPIPTSGWIVSGSMATSGGYVATGGPDVNKIFDGDDDTSAAKHGVQNALYTVELPLALAVRKVKILVETITTAATLTTRIEGSTNGTEWDTLVMFIGNQDETTEITLAATGEYKFYRLNLTTDVAATIWAHTFALSLYDAKTYSMAYSAPEGWPSEWDIGQRAMISIPENTPTGAVVSNTIDGKSCSLVMLAGRRYELRYNGTSFDAKEV